MIRATRLLLVFSLLAVVLPVHPTQTSAAGTHQTPLQHGRAEAVRDVPLVPGTTAIIRADGGCLRLRNAPNGNRLDCFAEGSLVEVLDGAEIVADYRWQRVSIGSQTGSMK